MRVIWFVYTALVAWPTLASASISDVDRPCPFETFDFKAKFETYIGNARVGDFKAFRSINGDYGREPSVHAAHEGAISTRMAFAHFGGVDHAGEVERVLVGWKVLSESDGDGIYGGHRIIFASMNGECETCRISLNREKHYILEFGDGCDLEMVQELWIREELLDD